MYFLGLQKPVCPFFLFCPSPLSTPHWYGLIPWFQRDSALSDFLDRTNLSCHSENIPVGSRFWRYVANV
jgi:hypothetical protein